MDGIQKTKFILHTKPHLEYTDQAPEPTVSVAMAVKCANSFSSPLKSTSAHLVAFQSYQSSSSENTTSGIK